MIQCQLKLRLNTSQEKSLNDWLWMLTGVWNWAVLQIGRDATDKIYYSEKEFHNLLANHGTKMGVPSHTLQGMLALAHLAWKRCCKKLAKRPRLRGNGNRLNSIPFPDAIRPAKGNHIAVPGLGSVRFQRMEIPAGKIKCGRIVKRAAGWYLCLFVAAEPKPIPHVSEKRVGIDPGFSSLLTIAESLEKFEKVDHPRELERLANRLAQAQRGHAKVLGSRIQERIANQRKDRNPKLSRRLVAQNFLIAFSADEHAKVAHKLGNSVASSGHAQLRSQLNYKSRAGGREYSEVSSKFSTVTCSDCGRLSGPTGLAGLSVRQWRCSGCGSHNDRDVNAAVNTLHAAFGTNVERAA